MSRYPSPVDIHCADCGLRHDYQQRSRILRRMTREDAYAEYPCLFDTDRARQDSAAPGDAVCEVENCWRKAPTGRRCRVHGAKRVYLPCPSCGGDMEQRAKRCRECDRGGRPRKHAAEVRP